jgi:D-3-phosphoglycerate dehydrogenase
MSKVLITDHTFDPLDMETSILQPLGCVIDARQCRTPSELCEAVKGADYIITQFAPVNAEVIAAMDRAKIIVRYGIGVDNVDLDAARSRGIPVCNVPDYCIDEVADHTLAFILAVTRQVVPHCLHLRGGMWGLAVPLAQMRTLRDMTVGVVGFGRIGREVIRRLFPFGCAIRVYDPVVAPAIIEQSGATAVGSLDDLLASCDLITLHCPAATETRGMIDARALAKMRPGAVLVNLARGNLVDTDALTAALQSGRLGAAALDVCDPEPMPTDHPLRRMPNVILAPHIASTSVAAVRRRREAAPRAGGRLILGEPLLNVVNGVTGSRPAARGR